MKNSIKNYKLLHLKIILSNNKKGKFTNYFFTIKVFNYFKIYNLNISDKFGYKLRLNIMDWVKNTY
jgi:hypothetical protein